VASGAWRLRLHRNEVERTGVRPDILAQACSGNLRAIVIEHAQRPAGKLAAGRALDADLEAEALASRDRGRHAPHVHARGMRNDDDAESRVGFLMANAVRLMCHKHSPPDMLADFKRRPQHEFTERATRKLGVVLALDRDALPGQVASMWAGGPHSHGQLGPGI